MKLSQFLQQEKKEFVLSKQVLRSGTAVGALIREAEFGQSKADFTSKMSIALKEAQIHSKFWYVHKNRRCLSILSSIFGFLSFRLI